MRIPLLPVAALLLLVAATVPPVPATVTDGEPSGDELLVVAPAIAVVAVAPGAGALVEMTVRNSAGTPVMLELQAVDVEADDAGRPVHTGRAQAAATWVTFAEERLRLDPGDTARLAPAVQVPGDAVLPALLGLRVSTDDGATTAAMTVVVDAPAATPATSAEVALVVDDQRSTARTVLTNAGTAVDVLSVRTVVHSWTGREVVDVTTSPVLVSPGHPRRLDVAFETPRLPGPYRVTTVAADGTGEVVRADATTTVAGGTTALVALGVLALAGATGLVLARRRRAGTSEPATDEPGAPPPDGV